MNSFLTSSTHCSSLEGQRHCESKPHNPVRCYQVSLVTRLQKNKSQAIISSLYQTIIYGKDSVRTSKYALQQKVTKLNTSRKQKAYCKLEAMKALECKSNDSWDRLSSWEKAETYIRMILTNLQMTKVRALIKSDHHTEIKNRFPTFPHFPFHCTKTILKVCCFLPSRKVIVFYPFQLKKNQCTQGISSV